MKAQSGARWHTLIDARAMDGQADKKPRSRTPVRRRQSPKQRSRSRSCNKDGTCEDEDLPELDTPNGMADIAAYGKKMAKHLQQLSTAQVTPNGTVSDEILIEFYDAVRGEGIDWATMFVENKTAFNLLERMRSEEGLVYVGKGADETPSDRALSVAALRGGSDVYAAQIAGLDEPSLTSRLERYRTLEALASSAVASVNAAYKATPTPMLKVAESSVINLIVKQGLVVNVSIRGDTEEIQTACLRNTFVAGLYGRAVGKHISSTRTNRRGSHLKTIEARIEAAKTAALELLTALVHPEANAGTIAAYMVLLVDKQRPHIQINTVQYRNGVRVQIIRE